MLEKETFDRDRVYVIFFFLFLHQHSEFSMSKLSTIAFFKIIPFLQFTITSPMPLTN